MLRYHIYRLLCMHSQRRRVLNNNSLQLHRILPEVSNILQGKCNYRNILWLTLNWLWMELLQGGKSYIFTLCFYQNRERNYSYMKYLLCFVLFFPVLFSCNTRSTSPAVDTGDTSANRWVKPAGKDSLLLLTDRPPNLETPLKYFQA